MDWFLYYGDLCHERVNALLLVCFNLKRPGFYTLVFYTFINNSRSKQHKKNPTHPFVDITK